ncbi:MAG: FAD-binding protein [Myxococcales bacterium]|nr:FAD-binding protein [Myxococcales bacterium]
MPDIIERLRQEVGSKAVLTRDDEALEDYGVDESGLGPYPADCAVLCENAEAVDIVLALANETGTPVTPRGAGSGKVGGALPIHGGIVLSTEKMQSILEVDSDDLIAVVQPGVITGDLQSVVEAQGLFYPPDPASLEYCSIGGNAAANAGGPRAFKYGVTREYILGMEVSLMSQERLHFGRRTSKGVTGYDLVAGFVGSEGTFGVTTELTLRLLPQPPAVQTLLAIFPTLAEAGNAIGLLLRNGFRPRTMELMDKTAIDTVREQNGSPIPSGSYAAALVEIDGLEEGLDDALMQMGMSIDEAGATDVLVAQNEQERRRLWQARRLVSPSLTAACRHKVSEDICVPRGKMIEMIRRIEILKREFPFTVACYGHAGDGNLHVNILCDEDPEHPVVAAQLEAITRRLFEHTIELRGTLSGEHGIGLAKRDYMPMEQGPALLAWQRKWKAMWDPKDLLNPGKVLPIASRACHE